MPAKNNIAYTRVSNPLTLIALFSGVSESVGLGVLPFLEAVPAYFQGVLIWFLALFPTLIVVLFFTTLNFNRKSLYAPSDFDDETLFALLSGVDPEVVKPHQYEVAGNHDSTTILKSFWKPDGVTVSKENELALRSWLRENKRAGTRLTVFIHSQDEEFQKLREKFITEHNLDT